MSPLDRPIAWLRGEIRTPPLSQEARIETGFLLRMLQKCEKLSMPQSRPMKTVGSRCHELRIVDQRVTWRIMYRVNDDAIVILEVFKKKSEQTPQQVIDTCKKRLKEYDES